MGKTQIMSDSPNVMRRKHKGVLKLIKDRHAPHLLDLGGCSHHISNTVVYTTKEFGEVIEEFLQDLFYFFATTLQQLKILKDIKFFWIWSNTRFYVMLKQDYRVSCL